MKNVDSSPTAAMDRLIEPRVRRATLARKAVVIIALLLAGCLLVAYAIGSFRPSLDRSHIRTANVERGTILATVVAAGNVIPAQETVVSCPLDARVVSVLHHPGDLLEEGDQILTLDVSATRSILQKLNNEILIAKRRQDEEELRSRDEITELQTDLELSFLDLEESRHWLQQQNDLHDLGLIPDPVLRQAEVRLRKAEIRKHQLEQRIVNAKARKHANQARIRTEVEILETELSDLRYQLQLAATYVPHKGVLTWVVEDEGMSVVRGTTLARIADLETFRVEATVSDVHSSRLHIEQKAKIEIADHVLDGQVAQVFPTVEDGVVRFQIDLDDPSNSLLRANLRTEVSIVTDVKSDVLRLPKGPVIARSGIHEVFVVHGSVAHKRTISLGISGQSCFEVISGLELGDEVVVSDTKHVEHLARVPIR